MEWTAIVTYEGLREEFDVDADREYDARIEGARQFLEKHPSERPHDDKRRPYTIPVRPSYLVVGGFVRLHTKNDRRVKS